MATVKALKADENMANANPEKQKALDAALAQIERAFGKGSVMKLSGDNNPIAVESVSTGSLGLDIGLGIGGLPRGRIVEVYGPESSGKTTLALHVIAEAQKQVAHVRLSMRNMLWTRLMRQNLASMSKIY